MHFFRQNLLQVNFMQSWPIAIHLSLVHSNWVKYGSSKSRTLHPSQARRAWVKYAATEFRTTKKSLKVRFHYVCKTQVRSYLNKLQLSPIQLNGVQINLLDPKRVPSRIFPVIFKLSMRTLFLTLKLKLLVWVFRIIAFK